jgi:uracil phosphoribosyltransferase
MIRDKNTKRADFIFYSNRIIRLLVEEGLNHLPVVEHTITTPVGRRGRYAVSALCVRVRPWSKVFGIAADP